MRGGYRNTIDSKYVYSGVAFCSVEIRDVGIHYSFTDPTTSLSNRAAFTK